MLTLQAVIDRILKAELTDRDIAVPEGARVIGEASPDLRRVLSFIRTSRTAMEKLEEELRPLCVRGAIGDLNDVEKARHRELHDEQERLGADLNVGIELGKFLTRAETSLDPMRVVVGKGFVMHETPEAYSDTEERGGQDASDPIAALLAEALGGRVSVARI